MACLYFSLFITGLQPYKGLQPYESSDKNELKAIVQLDKNNLDSVLKSNCPVIVDVYSNKCALCHNFASIFENAHAIYGGLYQFTKIDILEETSLIQKFNISQLPTILFMKNGHEKGRYIGFLGEQKFLSLIDLYFASP